MAWFAIRQRPLRARRSVALTLEALEDRLTPATANLTAYRPVTEYLNFANFRVAENVEQDLAQGPGIRINRDDDNGNGVADYLDKATATAGDNDLVRVDLADTGAAQLTFGANLKIWTSKTKQQEVLSGAPVTVSRIWVEYVGATHTTSAASASLTLTASDAAGTASDIVTFHTFRSVVVAIGGRTQDPAKVGDPNLGVFTIATSLYQRGYDVHLYAETQVSSTGAGPAKVEATRAIKFRNVKNVAIIGYSWGGGATYELAKGLQADASIQGRYVLRYTAYIDGITHNAISSEQRLPPGTAYHDNIYERREWLIRGNSVPGASNINASDTNWGSSLVHSSIDDNATVQSIIIGNLTARVAR